MILVLVLNYDIDKAIELIAKLAITLRQHGHLAIFDIPYKKIVSKFLLSLNSEFPAA